LLIPQKLDEMICSVGEMHFLVLVDFISHKDKQKKTPKTGPN